MKKISIFGLIFLIGIFLWVFNNLFFSFTGKSITDLILTDRLNIANDSRLDENEEASFSPIEGGEKTCIDSDGGKDFFILGSVQGYDNHGDFYSVEDYCKGANLTEFFCKNISIMYVIYQCPNGCSKGACISNETIKQSNETNENLFCTDTDGGLNYFVKGSCSDSLGVLEDACAIGGSKGWFLKEAYCEKGVCLFLDYDCLEGCSKGRCLEQGTVNEKDVFFSPEQWGNQTNISCVDSDKGTKLYEKGIVRDSFDTGGRSFEDECILLIGDQEPLKVKNCQGQDCFLREGSCKENGRYLIEPYPCPKGCVDGACVKNPGFFEKVAKFFEKLFKRNY